MRQEFKNSHRDSLISLIRVFKQVFWVEYNTILKGGGDEPLYTPRGSQCPYNTIYFTRDYISSALHESAHWCIAGDARRELCDFGYWYEPDGRSDCQQVEFERVEIKPQALERIFSYACGQVFRISVDNLTSETEASLTFTDAVHQQTLDYCLSGLPGRAHSFAVALAKEFGQGNPLDTLHYCRSDLN